MASLDNRISRVYLWEITEESQKGERYGYHGNDIHPCDAEYVIDTRYGYIVATEDEEAPDLAPGWSIKPAEIETGWIDWSDVHSVACLREHGSNEYTIAMTTF